MRVQWQKLLLRTGIWLCAEISLTVLGLDDLADYSEYIFQNRSEVPVMAFSINAVASV